MSSLQKFHRRTNNAAVAVATMSFTTIGSGSDTVGYWLGGANFNALIAGPKTTEVTGANSVWGSEGTTRNTTSTIDGLTNTNTLYALGSAAHPTAYYCKTLTTGGYSTWYLPAINELMAMYSNKSASPFATANGFNNMHRSSTEHSSTHAKGIPMSTGVGSYYYKNNSTLYVRPARRVAVATTIGSGDSTNGYWLGTAGDGVSKLIVAPQSTEIYGYRWSSLDVSRNTTSTTDGLANTNTLYSFGSAAHPAAYYCKTLTTGGYNTWYLPAIDELTTMYTNRASVPFGTANGFHNDSFASSTEANSSQVYFKGMGPGTTSTQSKSFTGGYARAVRRV